ncbi:MAG: hypothetical protein IKJ43_03235 [Bacilli bacterium]|nr:hypothetical protein [Bacilli bacterium]
MAKEQLSTPRDKEKEKRQDIEFNKRREILDNYFNRNYDSIVPSRSKRYQEDSDLENTTSYKPFKSFDDSDPLEKTGEIDNVGIEELKKLVAQLKELDFDDDSEEIESNQSKSNGKVLTKVAPGYKKNTEPEEKKTNDYDEIASYFKSFFVLVLTTAAIGTVWLLNIINHI